MTPSSSQNSTGHVQKEVACRVCGLNKKIGGIKKHEITCLRNQTQREELGGAKAQKIFEKKKLESQSESYYISLVSS